MTDYITIALAKGRLADLSIDIFEKIGMDCSEIRKGSRKLVLKDERNKVEFIMVKAVDVPTYVEYGVADIGIVGKDTLLEEGRNLYETVNLKFGSCKMVVAGFKDFYDKESTRNIIRVATKYPRIAKDYFRIRKRQTVEIIKLNGSVELAPLVGLSDIIVDIVESGRTLKENGLSVLEEICDISARLVVNRASMKMQKERIIELLNKINNEVYQ
jgi:ATP phosphoribosyltransferase